MALLGPSLALLGPNGSRQSASYRQPSTDLWQEAAATTGNATTVPPQQQWLYYRGGLAEAIQVNVSSS